MLQKKLLNLAVGELAAIIVFIFVYRTFDLKQASYLSFLYLIFILLQGSSYWFYRYRLMSQKRKVSSKAIQLLRILRKINMVLIIGIAITIPFIKADGKDLLISIGIFLFGIIEYINYYWYRLSYGKSGFNIKKLLNTKLRKSNINQLISNGYK